MATEIKLDELLELGKRLCKESENEDKNLLEMVNIKEFRHSSILGYLLNRTEDGCPVYLQSFLSRFLSGDRMPKLTAPKVRCEASVDCGGGKRPIDILVEDGDFALIIENKCRGAIDQELQIQDYWTGVGKLGHAAKDIFVLYLPALNAYDSPSDVSLGAMKERFAPNGDLYGQFFVRSYRELILPWLKEDVLPNVRSGSDNLVTSLRCYIDLLEGAYGERSGSRDIRNRLRASLEKETKISDASELWESATDLLRSVDRALQDDSEKACESRLSESDADCLTALQSALWQIRSVLREENQLLDVANLSYEVYWLLRKNPTVFAAKFVQGDLDSGLFFRSGRKQSAWDSVKAKIGGREHWVEVWFKADEFKRFCEGQAADDILTFGIGDVNESECPALPDSWTSEYLAEKRWLAVSVKNEVFETAKAKTGGEMLWEIAKIVAAKSKEFSDTLSNMG